MNKLRLGYSFEGRKMKLRTFPPRRSIWFFVQSIILLISTRWSLSSAEMDGILLGEQSKIWGLFSVQWQQAKIQSFVPNCFAQPFNVEGRLFFNMLKEFRDKFVTHCSVSSSTKYGSCESDLITWCCKQSWWILLHVFSTIVILDLIVSNRINRLVYSLSVHPR